MNTYNFSVNFESEEACRLHFKSERDKVGVRCVKCKCRDQYWLQNKWSYECKNCGYRTSLRKGTIMESSKLPFVVWYKTMFLMSITDKKLSASKIQRKLGLKRYEPVWFMVNKLRSATEKKGALYTLENLARIHKNYYTIKANEIKNGVLEDEQRFGQFEAKVLDLEKDKVSISPLLTNKKEFSKKSKVSLCTDITDCVELHFAEDINKRTFKSSIKSVRISFDNAKRNAQINSHNIEKKRFQLYLNEFANRLNKKYFDNQLFDRIVGACII